MVIKTQPATPLMVSGSPFQAKLFSHYFFQKMYEIRIAVALSINSNVWKLSEQRRATAASTIYALQLSSFFPPHCFIFYLVCDKDDLSFCQASQDS